MTLVKLLFNLLLTIVLILTAKILRLAKTTSQLINSSIIKTPHKINEIRIVT